HAELPDRVVIDVTERTPALVWQAAGQTLLIDKRGNVLISADAPDLPYIAADSAAPPIASAIPAERVAAAMALSQALGAAMSVLAWTQDNGFVATLADQRQIIFGPAERVPAKLAVVSAVLQGNETWKLLDVREPDRPYFK